MLLCSMDAKADPVSFLYHPATTPTPHKLQVIRILVCDQGPVEGYLGAYEISRNKAHPLFCDTGGNVVRGQK